MRASLNRSVVANSSSLISPFFPQALFASSCEISERLSASKGACGDSWRRALRKGLPHSWTESLHRYRTLPEDVLQTNGGVEQCESNDAVVRIWTALLCASAICIIPTLAPIKQFNREDPVQAESNVAICYLPGLPDSESALLAVLAQHANLTHCTCPHCGEFRFVVDNCGIAIEKGKCPKCAQAIGGDVWRAAEKPDDVVRPSGTRVASGGKGYWTHDPLPAALGARQISPTQLLVCL